MYRVIEALRKTPSDLKVLVKILTELSKSEPSNALENITQTLEKREDSKKYY